MPHPQMPRSAKAWKSSGSGGVDYRPGFALSSLETTPTKNWRNPVSPFGTDATWQSLGWEFYHVTVCTYGGPRRPFLKQYLNVPGS